MPVGPLLSKGPESLRFPALPQPSAKDFTSRVTCDLELLQQLNVEIKDLAVEEVDEALAPAVGVLLEAVFTRQHGWDAQKANPALAKFFSALKPRLDAETKRLLQILTTTLSTPHILNGLLGTIQRQKDAAVRRFVAQFAVNFIRSLALGDNSVASSESEQTKNSNNSLVVDIVVTGLSDVWSNIRKDTARSLFVKGKQNALDESQTQELFHRLLLQLKESTPNWFVADGALHGILAIVQHELHKQAQADAGTYSPPSILWDHIRGSVCAPMFRHNQADIRTTAVKIFSNFLDFDRARQERQVILTELLHLLTPTTKTGEGNSNGLLSDFEVQYVHQWLSCGFCDVHVYSAFARFALVAALYQAESVLAVVAVFVKKSRSVDAAYDEFFRIAQAISPYTGHTSSIARQGVADVFRAFLKVSPKSGSATRNLTETVLAHRLGLWFLGGEHEAPWRRQECCLLVIEGVVEHLIETKANLQTKVKDAHRILSSAVSAPDLVAAWYAEIASVVAVSTNDIASRIKNSTANTPDAPDEANARIGVLLSLAFRVCTDQRSSKVFEVRRIAKQVGNLIFYNTNNTCLFPELRCDSDTAGYSAIN